MLRRHRPLTQGQALAHQNHVTRLGVGKDLIPDIVSISVFAGRRK